MIELNIFSFTLGEPKIGLAESKARKAFNPLNLIWVMPA
jgi:hypothetical protein